MSKGTKNLVVLIGNLGADPDVRYSQTGTAIAKLNVATTESIKDGEGWKDETEWTRVTVFGKAAEFIGNYGSKGRKVYVEGRLHTSSWEDGDGVKKYMTEVIAREVQLMDKKDGGEGGGHGSSRPPKDDLPPLPNGQDEDLPF